MTIDLPSAVDRLRRRELVAIPTETVYGLAADARSSDAVRKIFALKGRPATNPLIVHVASIEQARRCVRDWPGIAQRLAEQYWPGPLTLVLPKTGAIVPEVSAGRDTVAIRVPAHPIALELLRRFEGPVAAPSANRSTHVSPTRASHVIDEFGDVVPVLDGGACDVGIESTVLDLTTATPRVLRPGQVTTTMLEAIVGRVDAGELVTDTHIAAASPGQHAIHYAPRTPAFRFEAHERDQLDLTDAAVMDLALDPGSYARHFYARLRLLDAQQLRAIYIELPPDVPVWSAVRDRIRRATRPITEC
ncbi:MAG TPA: L-threonylcarbamoyladenylate synthase [Tepidisphaeraceae bacterium]|nr:L-threonylcarbamoyladenylate synthase [Tepidisphaeraceae bacterium]